MKPVIQIIQVLVIIQQLQNIRCQNYGEHEILRYFSLGNSEEQLDPDTDYSANDANNQAAASLNLQQYQVTEDFENLDEHSRADYARTKKLFRIKNPFQKQSEGNQEAETNNNQNTNQNDNNLGASNQYSSLHFSLPSDDYIQKLRAENQYYQQQQSTPSPNTGYEYAATPVPQYQFSTIPSGNYDNNNQQSNQIQLDSKISQSQNFNPNANNYQYTTSNPYQAENIATTSYPYIQTSIPNNNQFVGTGSNPYLSSSLPLYLTSPQNMQSYISSPYSQTTIQSASPEYNNNNYRGSSTIGNNLESYDKNDQNKNMQVEYYDNSVNGVKYPLQQYQNEYQATTLAPVSSPYNAGINALSKSLQELSLSQLQNFAYPQNQQDYRSDGSVDISENQNTHRAGSYPASNPYLKYMQQEYQNQNNRPQDEGQENNQRDYPNGDFSWKLGTKKVSPTFEAYPDNNIKTYHPSQSGGDAISQISFNMETGKQNNYDQISKATSKNTEGQDFTKSVGNPLENIKQSQQYSVFNNNQQSQSTALSNNVFQNNAENQRSKYNENSIFSFGNNQHDLVTASPTYNFNPKEISNERTNSLFDHAKALKAIVPIDMSNVGNSESQGKNNGYDGKTRFNLINFNQDQSDAVYKDKNSMYGFNIKTKPENFVTSENFKQFEQSAPFFSKKQQSLDMTQNMPINFAGVSSSFSFNSHPEGQQFHNNQQTAHRFQAPSEVSTFKVNDGPYRFAQEITSDNFRLNGNNLEQNGVPFHLPERINQNINSHQLDMLTGLSNKYSANKPHGISFGRPESEAFAGAISTINGFKVANPFNVDMKLVADVLKGKPTVDETYLLPFRDQFNKALPSKLEFSQLQHLLKNGNTGNFGALNDGISSFTNKYFEPYNGRYPPPGVKYSRSQEEEEHIPITDTGSNPFIGAVIDQDDTHGNTESRNTIRDAIALDEENITPVTLNEEKQKKAVSHRIPGEKHRHRNSIGSARYPFLRKYPRANGPHSLLRPPPFNRPRNRMSNNKMEPLIRKRRLNKSSAIKVLMKESDFGTAPSSEGDDSPVSILLRPPPQTAEARSDNVAEKPSS